MVYNTEGLSEDEIKRAMTEPQVLLDENDVAKEQKDEVEKKENKCSSCRAKVAKRLNSTRAKPKRSSCKTCNLKPEDVDRILDKVKGLVKEHKAKGL